MDKVKTEKINTQIAINPSRLIHLSFFVNYCQDNGLKIEKDTLEELHKFGLVYPALKVYVGVSKLKKIYAYFEGQKEWRYICAEDLGKFKVIKLDKKNYYQVGGLGKFNDQWLDYYFEHNMTEYPSEIKFSPWSQKQYYDYYTNTKAIGRQYQFLYDKNQLLAIKIALPQLSWVRDRTLGHEQTSEFIKKRIAGLYKFIGVYYKMEELYDLFQKEKISLYFELKKRGGRKPTKLEWGQDYDFMIPRFKKLAKKIIDDNKVDEEFVYHWREFLAKKTLINESPWSSKIKREYLKSINDRAIADLEDTHYMIYIINSFLYFLTGRMDSIKQVLVGYGNQLCPICGSDFKARKRGQITCGLVRCIKEHKNQIKREQRKLSKIS